MRRNKLNNFQISYDLGSYDGKNGAEQALNFIHTILSKDPNAKIMPAIEKDGKKSLIIEETNGRCSEIKCIYQGNGKFNEML